MAEQWFYFSCRRSIVLFYLWRVNGFIFSCGRSVVLF